MSSAGPARRDVTGERGGGVDHRTGDWLGAVDVGGTHLRTALAGPDGRLSARARVRIRPHDEISQVADAIRALVAGHQIARVIVGMPGRIDRRTGRLEQARNLPITWIAGLNAAVLSEQAGCEVVLAGDAELAVIGEAWFGAGTRTGDTAYLTLSTGVGFAATSEGRLLAGHRVGFQLGFIRPGGPGQPLLDSLASGQQLAALARATGRDELTIQQLLELADAGDRLLQPLAEAVQAELAAGSGLAVEIRRSALGDDAALAGAGAFAAATAPA